MNLKKPLSILEFSKLTGIKRENLRFYDRIGLLRPDMRGENNYRYYSHQQLSSAYLITSLREIGVGIEEIKQYATQRTPEQSLLLFAQQDARIQAEIEKLQETRVVLKLHSDLVKQALAHDQDALCLQQKAPEPLFLCPTVPEHLDDNEAEIFSYAYAEAHGVNLGYPLGALLPQRLIETGDSKAALRYYFKTETICNAEKPGGLYAIAYGRCDPWHSHALYRRLLEFIRTEGLRICGDAYEEYPLSDISVQSPECYCVRVEIQVERTADSTKQTSAQLSRSESLSTVQTPLA